MNESSFEESNGPAPSEPRLCHPSYSNQSHSSDGKAGAQIKTMSVIGLRQCLAGTTAHLVAEVARIQIDLPSEFWRIQLQTGQRCVVVLGGSRQPRYPRLSAFAMTQTAQFVNHEVAVKIIAGRLVLVFVVSSELSVGLSLTSFSILRRVD